VANCLQEEKQMTMEEEGSGENPEEELLRRQQQSWLRPKNASYHSGKTVSYWTTLTLRCRTTCCFGCASSSSVGKRWAMCTLSSSLSDSKQKNVPVPCVTWHHRRGHSNHLPTSTKVINLDLCTPLRCGLSVSITLASPSDDEITRQPSIS
jgi:hypothetical protein